MQYIILCIFKTVDPTRPSRSASPSPSPIIPTLQPSPSSIILTPSSITPNAADDRGPNSAAVALGCLFAITLLLLIVTILAFVVLFLKKKMHKHESFLFASNPGNVPHTNYYITMLYS